MHKKFDRWKMVGPAMNNYLLVERAQVARRDSDRLEGGGGLTRDTGSGFGSVSAPVVSSAKEDNPLVPPRLQLTRSCGAAGGPAWRKQLSMPPGTKLRLSHCVKYDDYNLKVEDLLALNHSNAS